MHKTMFVYFLIFISLGCGVFRRAKVRPGVVLSDRQLLQQKYDLYRQLIETKRDHNGQIEPTDCDSLLMNGLISATALKDNPGDIEQNAEAPGKWQRRALEYGKCYDMGQSRSSVSRDQLLGLYWYIWEHKRLDLAADLWDYGTAHNWIMGEGRSGGIDTIMNATMITLLARMIYEMGGSDYAVRHAPIVQIDGCQGYVCHLMVLQTLLEARVGGTASAHNVEILKKAAERSPSNPLLVYAYRKFVDGSADSAVQLLLKSSRFPADRLPESRDVCVHWSTARTDDEASLLPCPEQGKQHTGADFLFVTYLILEG